MLLQTSPTATVSVAALITIMIGAGLLQIALMVTTPGKNKLKESLKEFAVIVWAVIATIALQIAIVFVMVWEKIIRGVNA